MKKFSYILSLILVVILTGCSVKAPQRDDPPVEVKSDIVEVNSVKELIDAIKPYANINIKQG